MGLDVQRLVDEGDKKYDKMRFSVACWAGLHWEYLKKEWEESDFGMRPGFDSEAHAQKRLAAQVNYERELWFDITDVFHR